MTNEQFRSLLRRYLADQCTDYEVFILHEWYTQLGEESRLSLTESEKQLLEAKIWQNIQAETDDIRIIPLPRARWWQQHRIGMQIAAVVLLILGVTVGYELRSSGELPGSIPWIGKLTNQQTRMIRQKNETDDLQKISLNDKTIIWLSPGSEIRYPRQFSRQKREVTLVGNAFFNVAKNPKRPFLVYTEKLVTQVLGTSFWIRTDPARKAVNVEVVTGKVSVFEKTTTAAAPATGIIRQKTNSVVLTPNHRVTYFTENGLLTTGLVTKPLPVQVERAPVSQKFMNTALPAIMRQLQQDYGIDIILANERLERCTFTGDVTGIDLYDKLNIICKSIGATCEISGTHLLISGDGCNE
jgi:transmembrane sensor